MYQDNSIYERELFEYRTENNQLGGGIVNHIFLHLIFLRLVHGAVYVYQHILRNNQHFLGKYLTGISTIFNFTTLTEKSMKTIAVVFPLLHPTTATTFCCSGNDGIFIIIISC